MAHAYFPFYPGDFLAGVQGFTKPQRGDYITLLCYQWANGQIPADEDELQMVCGGPVHQKVLAKFPGGINARLEKERGKADQKSAGAIEANRVRWEKVRAQQDSERTPNGLRTDSERIKSGSNPDIQQEQEQEQKQKLEQKQSPPPAAVGKPVYVEYSDDFNAFWKAFPNKDGKGRAWTAWQKVKHHRPAISEIIAAIERAKKSDKWTKDGGRYISLPATWINDRGWEAELTPARVTMTQGSKTDDYSELNQI